MSGIVETRAVRRVLAACAAILLVAGTVAHAAERVLPTAKPERVGMSAERLQRISEMNRRYVEEGKLAGVVTLVARGGQIVHVDAQGVANLETGAPMRPDTLFRIFSMTKPITAVAALMLYEEGAFQLRDPVSKFLPELANLELLDAEGNRVPAAAITMQQLLTHTAGFSYGFSPTDPVDQLYREARLMESANLDEFVTKLAKLPLRYEPGTRWHYSVAVDVTGAVVERISGMPFDRFLRERLFEPLGMHDTFFAVPDDKLDRFGTNHRWNRETQRLEVLPELGFALARYRDTTFFSGGAGLVSTAGDYARFAEMLRRGGSLGDVRILGPKTVELMTMNHLPALMQASGSGEQPGLGGLGGFSGAGFGLGVAVVEDVPAAGVMGSRGEYSWGGAAGTIFWVDPVEDLFVIGMIQLMQSPWPLRSELKVLTYQALTELNGR